MDASWKAVERPVRAPCQRSFTWKNVVDRLHYELSAIGDMILRTAKDTGAIIRQRRRELDLDQETLAARVGVSRQWLIGVERGKPRSELALVLRTLDALGIPLTVAKPARRATTVEMPDIDAIVAAARKPRR